MWDGAVGKTTLVKEINQQANKQKIDDKLVMTTVSQNPSIMKSWGDIVDMLSVTMCLLTNFKLAWTNFLRDKIKKEILVTLEDI